MGILGRRLLCKVRRYGLGRVAAAGRCCRSGSGAGAGFCVRVLGLLQPQPPPLLCLSLLGCQTPVATSRLASLPVWGSHPCRVSGTPRAWDPLPTEQPPGWEALARCGGVRRGWQRARHRPFVYQTGENACQGPAAKQRCCGSRASPVASSITAKEAKRCLCRTRWWRRLWLPVPGSCVPPSRAPGPSFLRSTPLLLPWPWRLRTL